MTATHEKQTVGWQTDTVLAVIGKTVHKTAYYLHAVSLIFVGET